MNNTCETKSFDKQRYNQHLSKTIISLKKLWILINKEITTFGKRFVMMQKIHAFDNMQIIERNLTNFIFIWKAFLLEIFCFWLLFLISILDFRLSIFVFRLEFQWRGGGNSKFVVENNNILPHWLFEIGCGQKEERLCNFPLQNFFLLIEKGRRSY